MCPCLLISYYPLLPLPGMDFLSARSAHNGFLLIVPGVTAMTRQSNGLPTALRGPGELGGRGEKPRAASPDRGKAVGNPIDCRVIVVTPGTLALVVLAQAAGFSNNPN